MNQVATKSFYELAEPKFTEIAPQMGFEAECRFVKQLLNASKDLSECTANSLGSALLSVAAVGLTLNPAEKYAYLIPRSMRNANGQWEKRAFFEPSYMGLLKLATDSGVVEWVQAQVVYAQDEFIDNGAGEKPTHTYNAFSKDRGEFVGVYCVAKLKSGDFLTTIMPEEEVESIKARNETVKRNAKKPESERKRSTWDTDFNEMAKKAVIRRAFKTWPRSEGTRFAQAVDLSNENEGFEPLVTAPDINSYSVDQKKYFDQLIEKGDAIGMYLFAKSFDLTDASSGSAMVWVALTNSFEKGTKGKYQEAVKELRRQGEAAIEEYAQILLDAEGDNDTSSYEMVQSDLEPEALATAIERAIEMGARAAFFQTEVNQ